MYSDSKVYQIIIALLKKYGIKHCVLSAGSRNVPFVHSVEEDPYFKCYSVVDERSAGYFALGLAQELNEPVVISCTSSTATCNYWPAVAEAFYQNVPLIVMTSDRNPHMLGQWEDQMIDQVGMFDRHVKKSVNLPLDAENFDDFIYCQRLVNEAFLETNHHGKGPVHINIPMKGYNMSFTTKELPAVTKIDRLDCFSKNELWNEKITVLKQAKRVLVACGQSSYVSAELQREINTFFKKYNASVVIEYMANIEGEGVINTSLCMDSRYINPKKFKEFLPDIVISYGGNIMSGIKDMLRKHAGRYEHWLIHEEGAVVDLFKSITTIFECTPEYFFQFFNKEANEACNDMQYHNTIKEYAEQVIYPEFPYSSVYAIKNVVENIPPNSILHLSINDSIRITNFFKINSGVKVYANIGTYGIDGSMSSFFGQAFASNKPSFLIIGDLSFFYDMNSLRIRHIGENVRILLINNHGGGEFYYNGSWKNQASDLHTTARHNTKAEGWAKECDFKYLKVIDKDTLATALDEFMSFESKTPILLEIFTEMKHDTEVIYEFYNLNKPADTNPIDHGKKLIKAVIGEDNTTKLSRFLKK